MQRMNSGVRVCPPDLYMMDSNSWTWQRLNTATSKPVAGRKNFAISYCNDQVFVSGGMDNGQIVMNDLIMFDISLRDWTEFKQLRKKVPDSETAKHKQRRNASNGSQEATRILNDSVQTLSSRGATEATEKIDHLQYYSKFTEETQSIPPKSKVMPNP